MDDCSASREYLRCADNLGIPNVFCCVDASIAEEVALSSVVEGPVDTGRPPQAGKPTAAPTNPLASLTIKTVEEYPDEAAEWLPCRPGGNHANQQQAEARDFEVLDSAGRRACRQAAVIAVHRAGVPVRFAEPPLWAVIAAEVGETAWGNSTYRQEVLPGRPSAMRIYHPPRTGADAYAEHRHDDDDDRESCFVLEVMKEGEAPTIERS
eukprot:NODE_17777_length_926_cov_5.043805.p2 GENE.NODE_17777_length_926_cov_5.043805~~NODE_17777_length_926_cov_5.043805.p2  ORF type:complete len:209 (+),score=39.25 NODE_17777_length_926_cov_5.043805:147-773(+)